MALAWSRRHSWSIGFSLFANYRDSRGFPGHAGNAAPAESQREPVNRLKLSREYRKNRKRLEYLVLSIAVKPHAAATICHVAHCFFSIFRSGGRKLHVGVTKREWVEEETLGGQRL